MEISRTRYESKIIGINLYWISALAIVTYIFLRSMGGNLINWDYLGFEIIFPFYTAIMIGECVKTRSDPMFEVIEAQSTSLFGWVFIRYFYVFIITGLFSILGMLIIQFINPIATLDELVFVYLTTAYFLSSLVVLCSLFTKSSHAAVAICGVYWLFSLMVKSLLRFSFVQYIYLFMRYAVKSNPIWIWNKCVLTIMGLAMWLLIYMVCKRRTGLTQ